MMCSLQGCTGEYEAKEVTHTVRHQGRIVVIDRVPAEVCSVCGDVLLRPETILHIEELLRDSPEPVRTVPVYKYA